MLPKEREKQYLLGIKSNLPRSRGGKSILSSPGEVFITQRKLNLGKNYFLLKKGLGKNYRFLGRIYTPELLD